MDMTEGERKTVRDNAQRKSEAPMYQEEMREQLRREGYQERTSQVAVKWRIIIVASFVSRILSTTIIKLPDTFCIPLVVVLKNY